MPCTRRRLSATARSGTACCRIRPCGPGRGRASGMPPRCSPARSIPKATWRCSSIAASATVTAGRFPPGSSPAARASIFRSTTTCSRYRCSTSSPSPPPTAGRSTGRRWRGSIPSVASCSRPRATSSRSPRPHSAAARSSLPSRGSNGPPAVCRRSRVRPCRGSWKARLRGCPSGGSSFPGSRPKTACATPTCHSTASLHTPGSSPAIGS